MAIIQKEYEEKLKKVSIEKTKLLKTRKTRKRFVRRISLPALCMIAQSPTAGQGRKLSSSLSDSAICQKLFFECNNSYRFDIDRNCKILIHRPFRMRINSSPLLKLPILRDENRVESPILPASKKVASDMDNKSNTSFIEKLRLKFQGLTAKVGTEKEENRQLTKLREPVFSSRGGRTARCFIGTLQVQNSQTVTKTEKLKSPVE